MTTLDIPQILQYWGTPFITILYRCFLNREPDPEGLKYYLGRLTQGVDRLIIIEQFLKAPEVKQHLTKQQLLFVKIEISRLKALQPTDFLPITRWISNSSSRNQRIMMNRIAELQFRIEQSDIPPASNFIKQQKILKQLKIEKLASAFQHLKHKTSHGSQASDYENMLSESERTLFKKIIKQL